MVVEEIIRGQFQRIVLAPHPIEEVPAEEEVPDSKNRLDPRHPEILFRNVNDTVGGLCILLVKENGQRLDIQIGVNARGREDDDIVLVDDTRHVCRIVARGRHKGERVNHRANLHKKVLSGLQGIIGRGNVIHVNAIISAESRILGEQMAHLQIFVKIIARNGRFHELTRQRSETRFRRERLAKFNLGERDTIILTAIDGMENALHIGFVRAVNIVSEIFLIWVIDVGLQKPHGNLLIRGPV